MSVGQAGRAKTCQGAREKLPQKGKRNKSVLKNPPKDADLCFHLLVVLEGNAVPPAHFGKSWVGEKSLCWKGAAFSVFGWLVLPPELPTVQYSNVHWFNSPWPTAFVHRVFCQLSCCSILYVFHIISKHKSPWSVAEKRLILKLCLVLISSFAVPKIWGLCALLFLNRWKGGGSQNYLELPKWLNNSLNSKRENFYWKRSSVSLAVGEQMENVPSRGFTSIRLFPLGTAITVQINIIWCCTFLICDIKGSCMSVWNCWKH